MLIANSVFENNSATLAGAMLVDGYSSSVNITDTLFTYNTASTNGAVLYMINALWPQNIFTNVTLIHNSAESGAISLLRSNLVV